MCSGFFDAMEKNESVKFAARPTLPENGLPATGTVLLISVQFIFNFVLIASQGCSDVMDIAGSLLCS